MPKSGKIATLIALFSSGASSAQYQPVQKPEIKSSSQEHISKDFEHKAPVGASSDLSPAGSRPKQTASSEKKAKSAEPDTTSSCSPTTSPKSNQAKVAQPHAQLSSGSIIVKYQLVQQQEPEIEVITGQSVGKDAEHEVFCGPSSSSLATRIRKFRRGFPSFLSALIQGRFGDSGTTNGKRDTTPANGENSASKSDSGTIGAIDEVPANNESSADKSSISLLNNELAKYLKLDDESDKQTLKDKIIKIIQDIKDIDCPDSAGISPLALCLHNDNQEMTSTLIKHGANPARKDTFGRTALHQAVMLGAKSCIDTLLEFDSTTFIGDTDKKTRTALHYASISGQSEIVEKITTSSRFDCAKHLDIQDQHGCTPIACAVYGQNANCMEHLINKGANIHIQDYRGRSLIARACLSASRARSNDKAVNDIVKALMKRGVQPTTRMESDLSCLHLAALTHNVELLQLLLDAGLDPTQQDSEGMTPLHHAAEHGSADIVQLLLSKAGESANTRTHKKYLPLHCASSLQQGEHLKQEDINTIIRHILKKTDDPNTSDSEGKTPLITACHYGRKDNVQELLEDNRVKPDTLGAKDYTPLFYAVDGLRKSHCNQDDCLAVMAQLLKSGADVNARDPNGKTLLSQCIAIGKPAVVKTLLTLAGNRVNVNQENHSDGYRPLVQACLTFAEPYEIVQALLERKADPNLGNIVIKNTPASNTRTALHAILRPTAAVKKTEERLRVAQLLIKHKANPYQPCREDNDCTPLHLASLRMESEQLAIQMIEHTPPRKQDLMLRQGHGLTAAQIAGLEGLFSLQKLLIEKMT